MAEIVIIGAAIVDVLVRPVNAAVFETGSYPAEEICMSPAGPVRPAWPGQWISTLPKSWGLPWLSVTER